MKIWSIESGECLNTMQCDFGFNFQIELLSNDRVAICADSKIKIWHIKSGLCLMELQAYFNKITNVKELSNDCLFTLDDSCIIKLWDLKIGQCMKTYQHQSITAVAFLSNETLVYGSANTLHLCSLNSGESMQTLENTGKVDCICVLSDEKIICASANNGELKVWCLKTNRCIQAINIKANEKK